MATFNRRAIIALFTDSVSGKTKRYVRDGKIYILTNGLYDLVVKNEIADVEFEDSKSTVTTTGAVPVTLNVWNNTEKFSDSEVIKLREKATLLTEQLSVKRAEKALADF